MLGGRFIARVGGEQFAVESAVTRLRDIRDGEASRDWMLVSAADPLNLSGILAPGARVHPLTGGVVPLLGAVPIATVRTPKVTIAPVASLKADSLITICATLSRTWTCRKIGTKVAGSVDASVAPSNAATIHGTPRTKCAAVVVIAAVITTQTVAMTTIVIQTCFITWNRSDAPPSKRM